MLQHATLKKIQLQAAAAEIKNQARLNAVAKSPLHSGANQPRFLLGADHFQLDARLPADAIHQLAVVARFAGRGGGHGAIGADLMLLHAVAKLAEGAGSARDRVVVEHAACESVVAQADGGAFTVKNLNVMRGSGPGNHQPNGVGPGVDRSQLNGGGHSYRQSCDRACEGW